MRSGIGTESRERFLELQSELESEFLISLESDYPGRTGVHLQCNRSVRTVPMEKKFIVKLGLYIWSLACVLEYVCSVHCGALHIHCSSIWVDCRPSSEHKRQLQLPNRFLQNRLSYICKYKANIQKQIIFLGNKILMALRI